MRPVAPRIKGIEEHSYDGDEFKALTFARVVSEEGSTHCVMRWRPSDEERQRLAGGEDVFLLTLGGLPAHQMHVGYPYGELEDPQ